MGTNCNKEFSKIVMATGLGFALVSVACDVMIWKGPDSAKQAAQTIRNGSSAVAIGLAGFGIGLITTVTKL